MISFKSNEVIEIMEVKLALRFDIIENHVLILRVSY